MTPGGIRIGSPAITTRGMKEADMDQVVGFIARVLEICVKVQKEHGKMLKEFTAGVEKCEEVKKLCEDVNEFSSKFYLPGKFL